MKRAFFRAIIILLMTKQVVGQNKNEINLQTSVNRAQKLLNEGDSLNQIDIKNAIAVYTKLVEMTKNEKEGEINFYYYLALSQRAASKENLSDHYGAIKDVELAQIVELSSSYTKYNYIERDNLKNRRGMNYFTLGLAQCKIGNKKEGCLNLSKAGEFNFDSYSVIQKYCQ